MRILGLSALAVFLAVSSTAAHAADATASTRVAANTRPPEAGALKPGRTAGVKGAQQSRTGLALIGAGAIIAVVVVAAGTGGGGGPSAQSNMNFAPTTTSP